MEIVTALNKLEHGNDIHWTGEGLPRLDVVSGLVGSKVTRKDITDAVPNFVRQVADEEDSEAEPGSPTALAETEGGGDSPGQISVLDMPIADVLSSHELTLEAIDVLSEMNGDLLRERDLINKELQQVSLKGVILERQRVKHETEKGGDANMQGIRDYLDKQKEVREMRARRAQAFIGAGTTQEDVAKALTTSAPIDQAMRRKNVRGAQRPTRKMMR